jgi:hypothetical protein
VIVDPAHVVHNMNSLIYAISALNWTEVSFLRAFPIDTLKFKLKFSLRFYFFYFSLPLFKTLPSDSLFLTLFYLNIHSLFIFYYFLLYFTIPKIPSFPIFLPHSLCCHSRTTSFLFLFSFFFSFFSPPPTYPLFSFYFSPTKHISPPLFISFLNSQTSHSEYLSPVSLFFSSFFFFFFPFKPQPLSRLSFPFYLFIFSLCLFFLHHFVIVCFFILFFL